MARSAFSFSGLFMANASSPLGPAKGELAGPRLFGYGMETGWLGITKGWLY